ncbi:MAG: prepilin peptidase [Candidatus Falkowbacteria bacterium]
MSIYFLLLVFVFGAAIGSFLNCMAWRIYHGQGLWGRSQCPSCNKMIAWFDNVPLFSWLRLRGKCRHCQAAIPSHYFWAELAVACLFLFSFLFRLDFAPEHFVLMIGLGPIDWHLILSILRDWTLISFLFIIFLMDLKWFVVADVVSLGGAGAVFVLNLLLGVPWPTLVLGALAGAGFFLLFHVLSEGAWMGSGDILIGLLMGVALGWPGIVVALFMGVIIAALWGIGLVLAGKKKFQWQRLWQKGEPTDNEIKESALPFGPFLTVGTLLAFYYGSAVLVWYLSFLTF